MVQGVGRDGGGSVTDGGGGGDGGGDCGGDGCAREKNCKES